MSVARPRLGEILVAERLCALRDVAEALAAQVIEGGRIGTVLVQREIVSLDDVGRCLSVQHGVPHADEALLRRIHPETLTAVPEQVLAEHVVLPLRLEDDRLHLAMLDPVPAVIEVVSRAARMPVVAYVAPELRLLYYLEDLCGIEREPRFLRTPSSRRPSGVSLEDVVESAQELEAIDIESVPPSDPSAAAPPAPRPVTTSARSWAAVKRAPSPEPPKVGPATRAPAHAAPANEPPPLPHERRRLVKPTVALPPSVERRDSPLPSPRKTLPFGLTPAGTPRIRGPIDDVAARLDAATTGAQIAELLVEPVLAHTLASALFWVRGSNAVGCCARGAEIPGAEVRRMVVSLKDPSLLQWAIEAQGAVRSDPDSLSLEGELARKLGVSESGEICVAPVILKEKVVNLVIILAKPQTSFQDSALDDIRVVCERAAAAYGRLGERLKLGVG